MTARIPPRVAVLRTSDALKHAFRVRSPDRRAASTRLDTSSFKNSARLNDVGAVLCSSEPTQQLPTLHRNACANEQQKPEDSDRNAPQSAFTHEEEQAYSTIRERDVRSAQVDPTPCSTTGVKDKDIWYHSTFREDAVNNSILSAFKLKIGGRIVRTEKQLPSRETRKVEMSRAPVKKKQATRTAARKVKKASVVRKPRALSRSKQSAGKILAEEQVSRRKKRRERRLREMEAVIGAAAGVEAAAVSAAMSRERLALEKRRRRVLLEEMKRNPADGLEQDTVVYFLVSAAREPLLTKEEEISLAKQYRESLRIEEGRQEMEKFLLRVPTLVELAAHLQFNSVQELHRREQDGIEAKERMIRANLRLVVSCAKRYQNQGLPLLDLWQEGTVGLIKGVERYDPEKGFRLSTYAYWWIRQAMTRGLAYQSRLIRLPMRTIDALIKINREVKRYQNENDFREPTDEELAELTGLTAPRVKTVLQASLPVLSLDDRIAENNDVVKGVSSSVSTEMVHSTTLPHAGEEYSSVSGMEMQTSLSGPNSYSSTCLAEVEQGLLKEGIQEVLRGTLTPREIRVLQLRYGLSGETACKVADVGVVLGLSRERTRQIEKEAIRKLIAQPGTDELREYLYICT
ncbi:hypothetical protein CYMTET_17978 [Cymbomonas tetramitiformis]|uniref:RNA polymerase sigma factor n=1 Tax=Cymbomonas tetramitiformis TaxID=36881 RepID=A0AAE0L6Q6_9CHLO|nr:hypothetical protein CYMTET_17978 [Cymbomonas tetramitiformis]